LCNLASIFLLFCAIKDADSYLFLEEGIITKYLHSLEVVKPPYYIVNLFKIKLFSSQNKFENFKKNLQKTSRELCNLEFGNTLRNRQRYVERHFSPDLYLIDIGAGKEFNYGYLSKKLESDLLYFPVDIDKEAKEGLERKINYKKYDNVELPKTDYKDPTLWSLFHPKTTQVLLSEVLEHMSWEDAQRMIEFLLQRESVVKLIITLPNRLFNKYYGIPEGETRHEDHHWEPDLEEAIEFFKSSIRLEDEWQWVLVEIGDIVEGQSPSFGIIVTRYQEEV
jgi:hypothetical protein